METILAYQELNLKNNLSKPEMVTKHSEAYQG